MSTLTEKIINKLQHLETVSEPTLQSIFDYICFLEARLDSSTGRVNQSDMNTALEQGYRAMAADEERESEAIAWSEALIGDLSE